MVCFSLPVDKFILVMTQQLDLVREVPVLKNKNFYYGCTRNGPRESLFLILYFPNDRIYSEATYEDITETERTNLDLLDWMDQLSPLSPYLIMVSL